MTDSVIVSAPGSTLITGEHAVIYGAPCIVAAIEQRATVELCHTDKPRLRITSQIAPPADLSLSDLAVSGPYRFVIAAVLMYREALPGGLRIEIRSEINHTLGLGSSAAITMAVLAALEGAAPDDLHDRGLRIIRDIQGRGSGADLAASLHGGVMSYRISADGPGAVAPLRLPPQMSLFNVGYKTPTAEVLGQVAAAREADPARINAIFAEMERLAQDTIAGVRAQGWAHAGPQLLAYQDLMARLGVSDEAMDRALAQARATPGVIGAKISGSGLGDCALAMGAVPEGYVPITVAEKGVVFHDA